MVRSKKALNIGVGPGPSSLVIGDLNRDGNLDLAVAVNGSHDQNLGYVAVLLGNGTGGFAAPKRFPAGFHPRSIAIGDLNRDRKPDLVVSDGTPGSGFGQVSILRGRGGGSFAAPQHLRVGSGRSEPLSVAIGNLNAGFYPDIAVANSGTDNVAVLLNDRPKP
jgi:FG-GAP-like repeat